MDYKQDHKICQSCGMPMMFLSDFGSSADGSVSTDYCKICMRNGHFSDEKITVDQMIEKTAEVMVKDMKITQEQALKDARAFIPTLKRWKECLM